MLANRVIPCLDVRDGRVVKGVRFSNLRDAGSPAELARFYEDQGADELVLLDVSATPEGRNNQAETVRKVRAEISIPLTVGGGVRSLDDAAALLDAGADKVGINTAAVHTPELINAMAERFGSQCTVLAIDAAAVLIPDSPHPQAPSPARGEGEMRSATSGSRESRRQPAPHRRWSATSGSGESRRQPAPTAGFEVVVYSGKRRTGRDAIAWAREAQERGAGEILLTSWDRDGTRSGYDVALLQAVSRAISIPLIASGGAAEPRHLLEALRAGADAVLAASIFHDGDFTVSQIKELLAQEGIEVRR